MTLQKVIPGRSQVQQQAKQAAAEGSPQLVLSVLEKRWAGCACPAGHWPLLTWLCPLLPKDRGGKKASLFPVVAPLLTGAKITSVSISPQNPPFRRTSKSSPCDWPFPAGAHQGIVMTAGRNRGARGGRWLCRARDVLVIKVRTIWEGLNTCWDRREKKRDTLSLLKLGDSSLKS